MIVAVGAPSDAHTRAIVEALARAGADPSWLDLRDLASGGSLSVSWPAGPPEIRVAAGGGPSLRLHEAAAIWWRGADAPAIPDAVWRPSRREFTHAQWADALAGLWDDLPARWVNHPARGKAAGRKTLQMRAAAEVGLALPRTLVTSDPVAARTFVDELGGPGRVVYKALHAIDGVWRETRLVGADDLAELEALRNAPVLFQEYVPAEADLRVTVVGDEVFAAAIDARDSAYALDWRVDYYRARVAAAPLPDAVADRLRTLLRRFGLGYGAFDLRRTPAGEHVFLELNSFGLWLFVELRTGQPITDAIAAHLAAAPPRA